MAARSRCFVERMGARAALPRLLLLALIAAFLGSCSDASSSPLPDRTSGWLAVVQDGEVRLIDPDDGRLGPLSPRGGAGPIRWSPDARSIAFESEGEIMAGLAEGRPRLVTTYAGSGNTAHTPFWAPDSTRIAYTVRGEAPGPAILDTRTGALTDVYQGEVELGGWWNLPGGVGIEHRVIEDVPAGRVYAVDQLGAMPRYLATGTHPVASPVDQRVLYIDGDAVRVWVGADEVVTLATGHAGLADPTWSSDGTSVAFADARGVWVVPSTGGSPLQVLSGARFPTFSSDGSEVAAEREGELLLVSAQGGTSRLVASGASPAWQPARRAPGTAAVDISLPRGEPPLRIGATPEEWMPLASVPAVSLESAFPNLAIDGRLADVVYLGGAIDRFYAVVLEGRIVTFPNDPEVTTATPFLQLPGPINASREGGLLALAFDPNFLLNGYVYVYYTTGTFTDGSSGGQPDAPRRNILSRFSLMPGRLDQANPASELVLLDVLPSRAESNQHNAGQLTFGADGYLYLSIGDTTTPAAAQDLSLLEGSVIRIDVSNSTAEAPYAIPEDNPFVGAPGARPEIWAYGFRNPWRFSIDHATGEMWAADVGSNGAISAEEVNFVTRGANYGWPAREGARTADCVLYDCTGMVDSLWSYPRGLDPQVPCVAIVGGYVYRGDGLEGIDGAYLATDLCLGYFWAIRRHADGSADVAQIGSSPLGPGGTNPEARISSFISGPDSEPYVIFNNSAELWKMVPASQVAQPGPVEDTRPPTVVFAEDGVADFFQRSCAACHGAEREGDVGSSVASVDAERRGRALFRDDRQWAGGYGDARMASPGPDRRADQRARDLLEDDTALTLDGSGIRSMAARL